MSPRTSAVALALGALLLLASAAPAQSKKYMGPTETYKGTVESVTRPREPGMHTRVVIRTWWWGKVELGP